MSTPDQIGRYRLERRLGSGAFGMVWLAHDDSLEALVAVKVMAENWAHRLDLRERFLAEARLLRRAASAGLVQVFDIGELPDQRPYFVMEYADRGTLEDRLSAGALPVPDALRLAAAAARGVAALHDAGIVHRDVKPSNVLIATGPLGQERILVADLGLAKSLAQASGLTLTAGSVGYMAPEQSDPGEGIDARADVYGLGALLYHLVTGSIPGPPGKIVAPQSLRRELPDGVQKAILRALEPDRERRWPTAAGFAAELDALADRAQQPAVRSVRRSRRAWIAAAVTATAVVATAAAIAVEAAPSRHTSALTGVKDRTGRISVKVPARWSHELVNAGWSPKTLGLAGGDEPGLTVASELKDWQDLGVSVSGMFVGLSEDSRLPAQVAAITHPGCTPHSGHFYRGAVWQGQVRLWTGCGGGGHSIEEISLVSSKVGQPEVYVQIRQDDGSDATDQVLDSLKVAG